MDVFGRGFSANSKVGSTALTLACRSRTPCVTSPAHNLLSGTGCLTYAHAPHIKNNVYAALAKPVAHGELRVLRATVVNCVRRAMAVAAVCAAWLAWGVASACGAGVVIDIADPDGAYGRLGVPIGVTLDAVALGVDPAASGGKPVVADAWELAADGRTPQSPVAADFVPAMAASGATAAQRSGTLWLILPPGKPGMRRVEALLRPLSPAAGVPATRFEIRKTPEARYDVVDVGSPVLRYNHGNVAVPPGIDPSFLRGDYIHPLYGPDGETLTDDYPKDHEHHRGVWWTWPVTRWKNEVRDIWWVKGVWSRPVAVRRSIAGNVLCEMDVENVWKWSDTDPIVREEVLLRAFAAGAAGRFVDIEVRLTGLADGVAIGGRPRGGYGGFALRAAPATEQKIRRHTDPAPAIPALAISAANPAGAGGEAAAGSAGRRAWIDYAARFPGGKGPVGIAIFEHPTNPQYPNQLLEYPSINCVMPGFPGDREVPIPKGRTLALKHRLWIRSGPADDRSLGDVWTTYAAPPKTSVTKK
jgi:hypothetical protein